MAYVRRLHFLLILEKALTFISDELDVFRMVSRYDNRRSYTTPYNSIMQFEYSMGREIGRAEFTERCNWMDKGERKPACSGGTAVRPKRQTRHIVTPLCMHTAGGKLCCQRP